MKKIVFCALAFCSLQIISQSSLVLTIKGTTNTIAAGSTIYTVTTAENTTNLIIDLKNTSAGAPKSYNVKRYDMVLHSNATATAIARFCFAGNCYLTSTTISPTPLTLASGESASSVQGLNQVLDLDLDEITTVGYSYVKCTFFNASNSNDSIQFNVKYNAPNIPTGLNEVAKNFSSFEIFPNPASEMATFKINSQSAFNSSLRIYNSLGALVSEKSISISEGRNNIEFNLEALSSGIYFATIKNGNESVTKKLVVK